MRKTQTEQRRESKQRKIEKNNKRGKKEISRNKPTYKYVKSILF